jgi:competence protein ComEC
MQSWMTGLVGGLLLPAWLPALPPLWLCAGGLLLALVGAYYSVGAWRVQLTFCVGVSLACIYGASLLEHRYPEACTGKSVTVMGVVSSLPRLSTVRDGAIRQRFEFSVSEILDLHCNGPRRLLLSYYGDRSIVAGERLLLKTRLKKPWGLANPGSFNMQSWFAQTGIDGTGTVQAVERATPSGIDRSQFHQRLRARLSQAIQDQGLPATGAGMLRALTVADRDGLDAKLWQLLQYYGVNHLLVISGLHVGIVGGLGYLLGKLLACGALLFAGRGWYRLLPAILSFGLALFYTSLAGFSLSTQRALVMLACVLLANTVRRSSSGFGNLLLAGALLLTVNPLAGLGSGFWLSFGAVVCLLWLGLWRPRQSLPARIFGTHAYMCLAMVPMTGWWFGGASMVAALANFMMVPLVTLAIVPLALLGAALSLLSVPGFAIPWRWAAVCLEWLVEPARAVAANHGHWLYTWLSPSPWELALAVMAVGLLVIQRQPQLRFLATVLMLPMLLRAQDVAPTQPTLMVMDVGQGTAVLFRSGSRTLLYDTGGGNPVGPNLANSVIVPFLRKQGVSALDTVIISHADNDHSAGAATLLGLLPVSRYRFGGESVAVGSGGLPCRAGEAWRWPSGETFQFLAPAAEAGLSSNDVSCVLQIEVAGKRILLPGDVSASRERALVAYWGDTLASDCLLAAHHGSRSSSSWAFLKAVKPASVLFSHGYGNRFGHPHPEVVERARQLGADIAATATSGAVRLEFLADGGVQFSSWREWQRYYWM